MPWVGHWEPCAPGGVGVGAAGPPAPDRARRPERNQRFMFFNARLVPHRLDAFLDAFLSGLCRTAGSVVATSSPVVSVIIVLPVGWIERLRDTAIGAACGGNSKFLGFPPDRPAVTPGRRHRKTPPRWAGQVQQGGFTSWGLTLIFQGCLGNPKFLEFQWKSRVAAPSVPRHHQAYRR